jgi:hypothetical protein
VGGDGVCGIGRRPACVPADSKLSEANYWHLETVYHIAVLQLGDAHGALKLSFDGVGQFGGHGAKKKGRNRYVWH